MNFERLVRPFQTVPFNPTPLPGATPAEPEAQEDIVLMIGRNGASIKTLSGNWNSSITSFVKEETREISRETSERRVENPTDPSQYVTVEDTDKVSLESGKKDTYKLQEIEFTKIPDAPTTPPVVP